MNNRKESFSTFMKYLLAGLLMPLPYSLLLTRMSSFSNYMESLISFGMMGALIWFAYRQVEKKGFLKKFLFTVIAYSILFIPTIVIIQLKVMHLSQEISPFLSLQLFYWMPFAASAAFYFGAVCLAIRHKKNLNLSDSEKLLPVMVGSGWLVSSLSIIAMYLF